MKNGNLSNKTTSSTPLNLKALPDQTFWLQEYLNTINDNIIALGGAIEELKNKQLEIESKLSLLNNKSDEKPKHVSSRLINSDISVDNIISDFLNGKINAKKAAEKLGYKADQSFYNLLRKKGIDYSNRVKARSSKPKKSKKEVEHNYPKNWESTLKVFLAGEVGCKEAASLCEVSVATFYYYLKREGIDYSNRKVKRGRKPKHLNSNYGYPELIETRIACEKIDFDTWRSKLVNLIDLYSKKDGIKYSAAQQIIFKEATNRYGIVWDEVKKRFNKEYERSGSSLEYAYFDEEARSIVYAIAVNKNEDLKNNDKKVVNK